MVPQAAYDAMVRGETGDLSMTLEGHNGKSVKLVFDVETLLRNQWLEPSSSLYILGLPLRAYYYTVMDISGLSVSFSPMEAYLQKTMNASIVI